MTSTSIGTYTAPTAAETVPQSCRAMVFKIAGHLFALPVSAVYRVIAAPALLPLDSQGMNLAHLGDRDIVVANLYERLAAVKIAKASDTPNQLGDNDRKFLIVAQCQQGNLGGILIDEPPSLIDLPLSAIQPFPKTIKNTPLNIASHIVTLTQETETTTIFLLNMNRVLDTF